MSNTIRVMAPHGYVNGNNMVPAGAEFDMGRGQAEVMVRRGLVRIIGEEAVKNKEDQEDGGNSNDTTSGLSRKSRRGKRASKNNR